MFGKPPRTYEEISEFTNVYMKHVRILSAKYCNESPIISLNYNGSILRTITYIIEICVILCYAII